ncbi:MAG: hypothetical protein K2K14_02815 [Ruminococcus sp.]|nr:hypothetical protein [Ruminococcus sp.]
MNDTIEYYNYGEFLINTKALCKCCNECKNVDDCINKSFTVTFPRAECGLIAYDTGCNECRFCFEPKEKTKE